MMHAQNIRYGILSGILLICTIMYSVTADSQKSVFAQITPAPEKFGSTDDATDSSPDIGTGNDNPQAITPSERIDDATEEESIDSTDSNGDNSRQITTEQGDETITTEEQEPDPTNQLVEAITNDVNEVLSAAGIISP